ncbi:SigE family RNA polymerase sigma factor [Kineosporia mesophila]|uniref:SigE family RNA polymerase sigma factor n=1 Tax=Kineosporia mesophila TaxID=566012 RepID=A0ABP6Z6H9_9ACTN|nr:SigE family RNA polymerase sigma factor [Kineosporia mesophila]MCD5352913.1 SigE family RNA polymerase sigma factor [Kineosporia mesophila]
MKTGYDDEFRAFVRERRASLLGTATLLTAGDHHLAEDLTQTALTALYVKWPAFRLAQHKNSYARRCLVNAFIDEKRRPWQRRERVTDEIPENLVLSTLMPIDQSESNERTEALYAGLRDLPVRMRAVLVLRYFQELSVEETAEAMNCSTGTVKSQSKRAIDKLRERMSPQFAVHGPHGAHDA